MTTQNSEAYMKGEAVTKCLNDDCDCYPWYGLAPHSHNLKTTGSFINSTEFRDQSEWPDNFVPDESEQNLMGTYFCPQCKNGMIHD